MEEGQTTPPPKEKPGKDKPKRPCPAKHWHFTWYPQDGDTYDDINQLMSLADAFAAQEELCPLTGALHVQAYICFTVKCRPLSHGLVKKAHWEKMRDKTPATSIEYCTRLAKRKPGGQLWVKGCVPPKKTTIISYEMLRDWQKRIADQFKADAPLFNRKVHWFWDPDGNIGKTVLARYFAGTGYGLCVGGKSADALYAIGKYIEKNGRSPRVVVLNITRSRESYICWEGLESICDGIAFSAKYESGQLLFDPPHVVCFANFEPDRTRMSDDRWDIVEVSPYLTNVPPGPSGPAARRSASPTPSRGRKRARLALPPMI